MAMPPHLQLSFVQKRCGAPHTHLLGGPGGGALLRLSQKAEGMSVWQVAPLVAITHPAYSVWGKLAKRTYTTSPNSSTGRPWCGNAWGVGLKDARLWVLAGL